MDFDNTTPIPIGSPRGEDVLKGLRRLQNSQTTTQKGLGWRVVAGVLLCLLAIGCSQYVGGPRLTKNMFLGVLVVLAMIAAFFAARKRDKGLVAAAAALTAIVLIIGWPLGRGSAINIRDQPLGNLSPPAPAAEQSRPTIAQTSPQSGSDVPQSTSPTPAAPAPAIENTSPPTAPVISSTTTEEKKSTTITTAVTPANPPQPPLAPPAVAKPEPTIVNTSPPVIAVDSKLQADRDRKQDERIKALEKKVGMPTAPQRAAPAATTTRRTSTLQEDRYTIVLTPDQRRFYRWIYSRK